MSWSQFLNATMGRIGALQKQTPDTFTGFNAIGVAVTMPVHRMSLPTVDFGEINLRTRIRLYRQNCR